MQAPTTAQLVPPSPPLFDTSRNRNMGRIGDVIAVDTFPPEVAKAFLRERVRARNPVAAEEDLTGVLERLVGLLPNVARGAKCLGPHDPSICPGVHLLSTGTWGQAGTVHSCAFGDGSARSAGGLVRKGAASCPT